MELQKLLKTSIGLKGWFDLSTDVNKKCNYRDSKIKYICIKNSTTDKSITVISSSKT